MIVVVFAVIGAIVGSGLFSGFGGGMWSGAALGALAGWMLKLYRRLEEIERGTERIEQPVIRVGEPGEPPTGAAEPEAPEWPEPAPVSTPPIPPAEQPEPATARAPLSEPADRGPIEPGIVERLFESAKRWFTTGNVPVKVGVILSLFGLGFLVKEAMDRNWLILPLELRLVAVALFGVALLGIGWRLRDTRPGYALSVQGGGIAVLYLTTYASFALYDLLPAVLAFVLLVVVTAAAGALAVLQDSRALAVLGIVGGFMAPVLVSTGASDHVLLFSYYAILNCAVVGIAWFKAWRELNVLGFLFTFVIGTAWGYLAYQPSEFASTEPFLILFVSMYTVIPVLFASRSAPKLEGYVDGTLVFGTPIAGFGLQTQLVGDTEYGLAISAVALAGLYVVLATYLYRRGAEALRVLTEAFLSLGVVFLTIAVPLALDARWTSVAWSLQGAAMVWLGLRQRRQLALAAGIVLQLAAAGAYLLQSGRAGDEIAILNGHYLGALLIAIAGWFSSWIFDRIHEADENGRDLVATWMLLAWGTAWWLGAGLDEIGRFASPQFELSASLVLVAGTVWAAMLAASKLRWRNMNTLGFLLVPAMASALILGVFDRPHPLARWGWLAWPVAFATHAGFLRLRESQLGRFASALHTLGYWLLAALLAAETHWWIDRWTDGIWAGAATLAVVASLILATLRARELLAWPIRAHWRTYSGASAGGALAVLALATLATNLLSPGSPAPLPYVPLLNPLELTSALVFLVGIHWYATAQEQFGMGRLQPRYRALAAGLLGLFLLTMAVARSVHHWADVPFDLERLAESNVLQASLSIVWGSTALAGMLAGARSGRRSIWVAGAVLMAVVVVKLLIVEFDNTGTVGRVVSFLGVGVLLLIVGYFAPVPPRADRQAVAH